MANTLRETTAPTNLNFESFGANWYKHLINNSLGRQVLNETAHAVRPLHPIVPLIADAVTTALLCHRQSGGSTVGIREGIITGPSRFAVSIYPDRTLEVPYEPSWELLFSYAIISADLLSLPDHALGTWFDWKRNLHVSDVVVCPSSLDEALALGKRHGQRAIYDLEAKLEISIEPCPNAEVAHFDDGGGSACAGIS